MVGVEPADELEHVQSVVVRDLRMEAVEVRDHLRRRDRTGTPTATPAGGDEAVAPPDRDVLRVERRSILEDLLGVDVGLLVWVFRVRARLQEVDVFAVADPPVEKRDKFPAETSWASRRNAS